LGSQHENRASQNVFGGVSRTIPAITIGSFDGVPRKRLTISEGRVESSTQSHSVVVHFLLDLSRIVFDFSCGSANGIRGRRCSAGMLSLRRYTADIPTVDIKSSLDTD
jgi:hypothetical protein